MVTYNVLFTCHGVVSELTSKANKNSHHKRNKETMYDMNLKLEDRIIYFLFYFILNILQKICISSLLNDMSSIILLKNQNRDVTKNKNQLKRAQKYFKEATTLVSLRLASNWISFRTKTLQSKQNILSLNKHLIN